MRLMIGDKKVSVIIPCKNEESALYSMLQKMPSYVDETIVVDNGSDDNTYEVAKRAGAKVYREKRSINGVGYGFAHQTGLKHASGDIIVALDGDDTYPLHAIHQIVDYMERSGTNFVSCARFPLTNKRAISGLRQLGIKILNLQVSYLYGYKMKDILSGMWAMKKEVVKKLNLTQGGWDLSPEIKLAALSNSSIHFSEYHISHTVRLNGLSKQSIWITGFSHMQYIVTRRFTIDRSLARRQLRFAAGQMRYALKTLLALAFLKSHTS